MKTAKQIAEELCPRPTSSGGRMVTGDDLDEWLSDSVRTEGIIRNWIGEIIKSNEECSYTDRLRELL